MASGWRVIMCGWSGCAKRVILQKPDLPQMCPYCGRVGRWQTATAVTKAIEWTQNDRRFLRSLRIAADDEKAAET